MATRLLYFAAADIKPLYLALLWPLNAASMLEKEPQDFICRDAVVEFAVVLAPQSVTAITLAYAGYPVA
jgi:hypothetical protein